MANLNVFDRCFKCLPLLLNLTSLRFFTSAGFQRPNPGRLLLCRKSKMQIKKKEIGFFGFFFLCVLFIYLFIWQQVYRDQERLSDLLWLHAPDGHNGWS